MTNKRPWRLRCGLLPTQRLSEVVAAVAWVLWICPTSAWAQTPTEGPLGSEASLREITVSSTRAQRALADEPTRVDILTAQDLAPLQVQDIRDLARDLPNLSVRRAPQRFGAVVGSTGRENNAGFNIRGLEGNRVLLLVDGIRMPREMSSGTLGSAAFGRDYFDLGLIDRVEVLRGSASALYGSDGLAGVVALYTPEPQSLIQPDRTWGGRAALGYSGEDGMKRLGATVATRPSETSQWLLSAQIAHAHELDNQGDNASLDRTRTAPNPQRDRHGALLAKWVWRPGVGQRHTLTAEHVDKRSDVEAYTGRGTTVGRTPASSWNTIDLDGRSRSRRDRLSWEGRFAMDGPLADSVRALVALQHAQGQEATEEKRLNLAGAPLPLRQRDVSYSEDIAQLVLQAEKTTALSPHWSATWTYGLDLTHTRMDDWLTGTEPAPHETYPLKRFPQTTERQAALFVQAEWAHADWSFIPALRYDHVSLHARRDPFYRLDVASLSRSRWSPRLGVIHRLDDARSLYANLSSGFRAPGPAQLNSWFENIAGGYKTIPNPALKPETSHTLDIGTRGQLGPWQWDAAVFAGRYRDFIEEMVLVSGSATPQDPAVYQSVNRPSVRIHGLEVKASARLSARTQVQLALGQSRGRESASGTPLNTVNPRKLVLGLEHHAQPWRLGVRLTHAAAKRLQDIAAAPAAGRPFAPPGYTTLDLSVAWQLGPHAQLSAAVHNLGNRKYWEWANVRGLPASSPALDAYTAPGRSFSLAWQTRF